MSNESLSSYRTFEDDEIEKAWAAFIAQNDVCDDSYKSLKIAFFNGWKSHERFYHNFYCDDGK